MSGAEHQLDRARLAYFDVVHSRSSISECVGRRPAHAVRSNGHHPVIECGQTRGGCHSRTTAWRISNKTAPLGYRSWKDHPVEQD